MDDYLPLLECLNCGIPARHHPGGWEQSPEYIYATEQGRCAVTLPREPFNLLETQAFICVICGNKRHWGSR